MIQTPPNKLDDVPIIRAKSMNPNHPKKGSTIFVEPIKDLKALKRLKSILEDSPRNYALFVLGINTAFRAGDLLSIKAEQVRDKKAGDDLVLKEQKTQKIRRVTLNEHATEALRSLLLHSEFEDDGYIFRGQKGQLGVPSLNRLVKQWCKDVGLKGNYGSHTLRKTWGYHQRVTFNTELPLLTDAFGHATQKQTLHYLCIQPEERKALYMNSL